MSKQKLSLQEQLLKSGLVSPAKAKTAKTEQRKKVQQQRKNNVAAVDEAKLMAQQKQAEQAEKARELNQIRLQHEAKKELAAQIKQLVELHGVADDPENGEPYHFSDRGKVKTLYVSESQREQLGDGRLAIVRYGQRYALVPPEAAQKIKDRASDNVIVLNNPANPTPSQDDPYAAYQVPDDLLW